MVLNPIPCTGPASSLDVERSEWHAELAEILHPAGEMARDSIGYTHEKANDLKEALVTLLKQAENSWPVSSVWDLGSCSPALLDAVILQLQSHASLPLRVWYVSLSLPGNLWGSLHAGSVIS